MENCHFLDVEVSRDGNTFVTSVYHKPTFSGAYTHFDSFLPSTYKFGMIYTLVFRRFRICSDWNKFHKEIIFLKDIFLKNGYPTSFIDKCFKTFSGNYRVWIHSETRTRHDKNIQSNAPYR